VTAAITPRPGREREASEEASPNASASTLTVRRCKRAIRIKSPKSPPLNINTLQKYYAAERSEIIRAHGIKHIAYLKYDMSVRCKRTVEEMLDLHGSAGGFPCLAAFS
jgi:hypothetical protein